MEEKTFGEYVKRLNSLLKQHPELRNLPIYYSVDDEGNAYHKVYYDASFCKIDGDDMVGVYTGKPKSEISRDEINAVVIN